jgi:predicted nucleotidyltransferase
MADLLDSILTRLPELCAKYRVRRLELFGSAVRGSARADSDLDFLVEFESMPPRDHADCYFGLLEELQTLSGRPVDLAELPAVRNPYFLEAIAGSRKVLYAA